MQQERGFDGDMMRQNQQDRRPRQQQQQQPPPNQPQRCPRCDSVNTKFCYYNNYSLSQPRYFCKTCRRYWTQGGTLRNVPVGGGCRKGKRAKITAASSSSASSGTENLLRPQSQSQPQALPPQLLQRNFTNIPGTMVPPHPVITPSGAVIAPALRGKQAGNFGTASGFSSMGSYYPGGGGFLSSLAAITSLNPHPQGFNQPLNQAFTSDGHLNDASNMSLLQGFNFPSFGTQQHHLVHQQPEFYQMGNAAKSTVNPIYPPDHESLLQSSRLQGSSSHHQQQNWHQQSFLNSTAANPTDETLWNMSLDSSTSTTSGNTNNINTTAGSPSLSPNEWPDLSGYGLPP